MASFNPGDRVKIYGHEIELEPADGPVTDIVILSRQVAYEPDGAMSDAVLISTTKTSTYMIQRGMIEAARDVLINPRTNDE